jgi:hypothetical protein
MNVSEILKAAAGYYVVLLVVTLLLLPFAFPAILAVLRFVLEGLNSFGAA